MSITTHREGEAPRIQRQEKNYKEHKLPCTMYTPQGVFVCVYVFVCVCGGGGEVYSNLISSHIIDEVQLFLSWFCVYLECEL